MQSESQSLNLRGIKKVMPCFGVDVFRERGLCVRIENDAIREAGENRFTTSDQNCCQNCWDDDVFVCYKQQQKSVSSCRLEKRRKKEIRWWSTDRFLSNCILSLLPIRNSCTEGSGKRGLSPLFSNSMMLFPHISCKTRILYQYLMKYNPTTSQEKD